MITNKEKKNFLWNAIGSSFNAFISLFLLIAINRINGEKIGGIFTYCFSIACLLYYVVNYCGRTFQVTDINNNFSDREYIINRIFSFLVLIIILIIMLLFNNFDFEKNSVLSALVLYRGIDAFSEVFYSILQKNHELYKVGISMSLKAMVIVIGFVIIDYFSKNIILSCWSIVGLNLLITLVYDVVKSHRFINKELKINFQKVLKIYKSSFFVFSVSFLGVYLTNVTKYNMGMTSNEMQNMYGILIMPATFVSLCGSYFINPFLEKINDSLLNKDYNEYYDIVKKIIIYVILIGIVSAIGILLLGPFVLKILYGLDFSSYRFHLLGVVIGATCYTISLIYFNSLTAVRKTFGQFLIYLLSSILGCLISYVLIKKYLILGAIISYILIMLLLVILYIGYFQIIRRKENERKSI